MTQFNEAYQSLTRAIEDVLNTAEGVPAHIKVDVLTRAANNLQKLADASGQEGAGQAIKADPVNQREQIAKAPTDAAPTDLAPKPTVQPAPTPQPEPEPAVIPNDANRTAPGSTDRKR